MKFLLVAVNSKYIHTNPALFSLYSYAIHYQPELKEHISLAEYTINQRMDEILSAIYKQKPDVLGFSVYIWNVSMVFTLVKEIKKIMPGVPIWLGGPEVSYRAEEVLDSYPELTGIMLGEGEQTFLEVCEYYRELYQQCGNAFANDVAALKEIKGLHFRDGLELYKTEDRKLTDLSAIPFLYQDLKPFEHKIIYYETSRGCPFRCSYCLSSIDKKVRLRDMEMVKKELQFFLDNKVPQVKFIDRTFNCNHQHAMEIWQYIKEHDNGITNFHFEIGADLLNEEELSLLNSLRPGAVQMEIGVQTTNEKTLREIRRIMDVEKLRTIVARLHRGNNIHIHLDLIAGLPYEDYESFQKSFSDVYRMHPEQLQLGFLKVLSGSHMKEAEKEYGICYTSQPPYEVLCTNWISYEQICKLKQIEEMVEIYYNSNQFTYTIPYLEQFFETPFALYEALADFYEKNHYFINTPSRMHRYHVFLEFAGVISACDAELVKELLTMDVYLRENAKSRPEFSTDLSADKETINHFYRMEVKRRETGCHILKNYEEYDAKSMVRMTHMEPFTYDIFGDNPSYQKREKRVFVLYDYMERNPLTYDAKILLLNEEVIT